MLLPKVLLLFLLVAFPPLPLLLALLHPLMNELLLLLGLVSLKLLDLVRPLLQVDGTLLLLVLGLQKPHRLVMVPVTLALGTL